MFADNSFHKFHKKDITTNSVKIMNTVLVNFANQRRRVYTGTCMIGAFPIFYSGIHTYVPVFFGLACIILETLS